MPVSRRDFLSAVGAAGAVGAGSTLPWISARGQESRLAVALGHLTPPPGPVAYSASDLIRLDSNENPHGPAPEAVDAIMRAFGTASRYPDAAEDALRAAIADHHKVTVESVLLGCGSTEILKIATEALTSPTRALLTVAPTFEVPSATAKRMGTPITTARVDGALRLDLDAMYAQCSGAGMVFICNPNNPTGTLHGIADLQHFVTQVNRRSPDTYTLIDEAYFEYADDPAYGTAIPLAVSNTRVVVSRTFSKVHGMAGLRAGYAVAHPETIRRLARFRLESGINAFVGVAALASLRLTQHLADQKLLNAQARTFAMNAMRELGYTVVPSQTNFFMTDIKRDPKRFQSDMRAQGVAVGRPFPPLDTYTRISIGTMSEMRQAMAIAADVLRQG